MKGERGLALLLCLVSGFGPFAQAASGADTHGEARTPRTDRRLAAERGAPGDADAASARVLTLVNEARSRPRRCGSQAFDAAGPLRPNALLEQAALLHSREMASASSMSHQGRDGSTPGQRVTRAGYQWASVGENVAAGPRTAEHVMSGWMASPEHCANIMSGGFTEMGAAFAVNRGDAYGVYWTLSLAAPR